MRELDQEESPETDSSLCSTQLCSHLPSSGQGFRNSYNDPTFTTNNKMCSSHGGSCSCLQGVRPSPKEMNRASSSSRWRRRRIGISSSYSNFSQHATFFLIAAFMVCASMSTEVTSQQGQVGGGQGQGMSLNTNTVTPVSQNSQMGTANARNINAGVFTSNSFGQFSSIPNSSSGGGGGQTGFGSYEFSNSYSRPTAYFIAGLASQIRKINSTAMMMLTKDKPFQLQFRTVCPFGNIVYDDNFAISINSGGNMTFTTKPNEFPSSLSHHSVADGRWHSITFAGDLISLDDHDLDPPNYTEQATPTPVVHWDTNSSTGGVGTTTKMNQLLHFFDGFVGCIRVPAPTHDHTSSSGRRQQNVQSHEENYFSPESPAEHQVVSLFEILQLRTPFGPCNDTDVELSSIHSCFNPDTFVLCSKCQNGATCRPDSKSDNPMNNECECPPNTEDVEYSGKYCEYPPPTVEEDVLEHVSPEPQNLSEVEETDIVVPFSAASNIDSTAMNSSAIDNSVVQSQRQELMLSNIDEPTTTTTTTTEAPQEFPFHLEGTCPCNNSGTCVPSSVHEGQNVCNCSGTGYQGMYCEADVDECQKFSNICNNGICINKDGYYECFCRPGWSGKACTKNFDDCLSNPCKNNATCHDKVDAYFCECKPGFSGSDCEEEIDECLSNPCHNGNCTDLLNDFFCTCTPGFEGKSCETNINDCEPMPCLNGGVCRDKINGYDCDCENTGFEGNFCQHNINDCTPDSCLHNSTCVDGIKGFTCSCHLGYGGVDCGVDLDECAENPCLHGQCFQRSNQSLYGENVDARIRDLLPPEFQYDSAGGFVCLCDKGYEGDHCNIDIDECALEVSPCGRNGNCKDLVNSYQCDCYKGFTGEKCETEINECDSNPCLKGECIDKVGDYECRCPEDYGAKNCGVLLTGCIRGPCENESTRDLILSFLNSRDTKTARQVCREWNESVLTNFPKKLALKLWTPDVVSQVLPTLSDPGRILTSVNFSRLYTDQNWDEETREEAIERIHGVRHFPNLKVLKISVFDWGLYALIAAINDGGLVGLEELNLHLMPEEQETETTSPSTTLSFNSLPHLKVLKGFFYNSPAYDGSPNNSFKAKHHAAIQSFVTAAPILKHISTDSSLNLEGKTTSFLRMTISPHFAREDCNSMIAASASSLKTLQIDGELPTQIPQLSVPVLPLLHSIVVTCTGFYEAQLTMKHVWNISSSTTPNLQSLEIPFRCISWPDLNSINKLTHLNILNFPCPVDLTPVQSPFNIACKVRHTRLNFFPHGAPVSRVFQLFRGAEVDETGRKSGSLKVEHAIAVDVSSEVLMTGFTTVLESYGGVREEIRMEMMICKAFYDEATNKHNFVCICTEGAVGKLCNRKTVMSFNGSGPVEVTTNDKHYENGNYELHFKLRTTLPDVLLIVGSGITYFYLTLSGGKLNLQSSLLNSLEGISVGQNLSNAELHKVWISVNSTHIALAADSQQTFYPIQTEDVHTGFNVTYIGGGMINAFVNNPSNNKVIKSQFIGCMQDIILNGESEKVIPDMLNSSNIEPGCKRTDQCKPNPCKNSGNCTDLWSKFSCKCKRPFLSEKCEHQYVAATFQHESTNNSLVMVEIAPEIGNKFVSTFDISMFVRTRKRNGTIFLLGNEVHGNYSVFLEAEVGEIGNLVVHAKWSDAPEDTNNKIEVYAVDGLQITDGSPHLISIQREKALVKISVNGTEHFRKSVGNRITFTPSVLYIGGKPFPSSQEHEPRVTRSLIIEEEEEQLEASTSSPEPPIAMVSSEDRSLRESTVHEHEEIVLNKIVVNSPFKGIIQDVRVNFSSTDAVPLVLGHSHMHQHVKVQNHYVVEFFPLEINSTYAMGEPLGVVEKQNLLEGVVSDDACKVNNCLNGGSCETTWNDFYCKCREGFAGRLCEVKLPCAIMSCPSQGSTCVNIGWTGFECISEVAFQGSEVSPHYHLISTEIDTITFNSVGFRFRTKKPGNVIYIANGSQSFRVSLEHEHDSQNQSVAAVALYIDGVRHSSQIRSILDGRWHDLSVKLMINEKESFHLFVDTKEYKLLPVIESGTITLDYLNELVKASSTEIVVGSHVEHRDRYHVDSEMGSVSHPEEAHSHFYRGCLDNIRIGDYRLPFVSPRQLKEINDNETLATTTAPTAFYLVESTAARTNLHLGCIVCYDSECENEGHCSQPEDNFECDCKPGWEGETCSVNIDECVDNDCRNGAICVDQVANYTCQCGEGYEGWKCDIDIDECAVGTYPCQNGGTCVDGIASYTCVCTDEWLGHNCEKRKRSSCRDAPCENGATCTDRAQQYISDITFRCDCAEGWEGETCSTMIDYCKNVQCLNGGTCKNMPLGSHCVCRAGFDGPTCGVNVNDCISQPCHNNGTCIDGINSFHCICDDTGFSGPSCEIDINECEMHQMCPVAQVCENLPGSYQCVCPDTMYCGEYCNIINPCVNKTCHNGGVCKSNCYDEFRTEWVCECGLNYEGTFCELFTMAPPDHQIDILLIIIPIIAALLIAATIGVVILVRMARQKRATRGVYSPSQQEYCNPRVELDNVMKPPPEERLI